MKILTYNIEFGSGVGKGYYQYLTKGWRYLFPDKKVVEHLGQLIKELDPDVVFLVEVKKGVIGETFRSLSKMIQYPHQFFFNAYTNRFLSSLPIERGNGCAVFSKYEIHNRRKEHFMEGFSKSAFEKFDILDKTFFVLHLPLGKKTRDIQLHELIKFVDSNGKKDVVILGDLNTFQGRVETDELLKHCGLLNANKLNQKTFPSWQPKKEFDYVLISKDISLKDFKILHSDISDHLPILVEI